MEEPLVERLRTIVQSYIAKMQYKSAVFWADKLVSLSQSQPKDVYNYCQCLYLTKQYHRAIHHLKQRKLHTRTLAGCYLAALCHYESGEHNEGLAVLDGACEELLGNATIDAEFDESQLPANDEFGLCCRSLTSSVSLLRGRIYDALNIRNSAVQCYMDALRRDVYCFEAFEALFGSQNLRIEEESALMKSLKFADKCQSEEEASLVELLYKNRVNKYGTPADIDIPESLAPLHDNFDVVTSLAERFFYACHFHECLELTSQILLADPFNDFCLPLHIAALKELNRCTELFTLGHQLVDLYPSQPIAWYAVGCYYLSISNKEMARRYLMKCTRMNRYFGPGWIALGHALAADTEHDQAIAAYTTAIQAMQGSHIPYLYIGLEYGLTNNLPLANDFFRQALELCPDDPFLLHERATTLYNSGRFVEAEKFFLRSVQRIDELSQEIPSLYWEPVFNNLGHTCRKLQKYKEAIDYHRRAWSLLPSNASTLTAIGYTYALCGDCELAIEFLNKALSLNPDDRFTLQVQENVVLALPEHLAESATAAAAAAAAAASAAASASAINATPEAIGDTHSNHDFALSMAGGNSLLPKLTWQDLPERSADNSILAIDSSAVSLASSARRQPVLRSAPLAAAFDSVDSVEMQDVSMEM